MLASKDGAYLSEAPAQVFHLRVGFLNLFALFKNTFLYVKT
jgi:hypothetical protein